MSLVEPQPAIAEKTANALPSKIISVKDLSERQLSQLKKAVEFLKQKENTTITIDNTRLSYGAKTLLMFDALEGTFADIMDTFEAGKDVSTNNVRSFFETNYRIKRQKHDPKVTSRENSRSAHREAALQAEADRSRKPQPISHYLDYADEEITGKLDKLANNIMRSVKTREALQELKMLDGAEIVADGKKIKILYPVFEDEALTAERKETILKVVKSLSSSLEHLRLHHLTKTDIKRAIDATQIKQAEKTVAAKKETGSSKDATPSFLVTELAGIPASRWANDIDKAGRSACLRAFAENPNFNFGVNIARQHGEVAGLIVSFNKGESLDTTKLDMARYVLEEMQARWTKTPGVTKAMAAEWLNQIWEEIDKSSELNHGDHLKVVFEKKSKPGALTANFDTVSHARQKGRFPAGPQIPALTRQDGLKLGDDEAMMPTENQWKMIEAMENYPVVMTHGPAGTGKTFWAAYAGLKGLSEGIYQRILLTAPAVEAEENLGFMPGDKDQKMHEHVSQILEHMEDILGRGNKADGQDRLKRLMETGMVEIAPHAFNRGATYHNTFYILDESQNASWGQLKTALTRLGKNSTFVFMGDEKQNDRTRTRAAYGFFYDRMSQPRYEQFIRTVTFETSDIRRHPLIKLFIESGDDDMPVELNERKNPRYGKQDSPQTALPSQVAHAAPAVA